MIKKSYNKIYKALKRFICSPLAVSLKKEKRFDPQYENWFVRMRYDDFDQLEREFKQIKEKTMTYIVSGKIDNKPFVMVDCAVKSKKDNSLHFSKKLNRLLSTKIETHFCLTGIDAMQRAISIFDKKCYENDIQFDFRNEKHIDEILEIYKLLINRFEYNGGIEIKSHFNRIYFINKEGVYFINIDDDMKLGELIEIPNNRYIKPEYALNQPIKFDLEFNNTYELIETCWNEILKIQDYSIDLKDKFSFIMFDDDLKTYIDYIICWC